MENNNPVINYYENSYNEDEREGREAIEFARSKTIIARYLKGRNMEIADVCGATGAYSFWLADMGHQVHLLDLVPGHIKVAQQKSHDNGIVLASYSCADARELPYESESMDMVLLMGALYHFQSKESRLQCLVEAFRVLKKGGIFICNVMNRYNYLISSLKYNHLMEHMGLEPIKEALQTGINKHPAYTSLPLLYGHTPSEISSEMTEAGFDNVELTAVDGIANVFGHRAENEKDFDLLLSCIELTESAPDLMGISRTIIATG
ncbi:MAG: methyltransferase domain-containing protein [Defluviitaleaceae bacterium]|nr:methyltransferase domain-containing protein [Defluviitaleaceae bacterium]